VIDGMSHKEYQQFILEVEDALYRDEPVGFLDKDELCSYDEPDDYGLVHTRYIGWRRKSYCQPLMEIKTDHKSLSDEDGRCHRCPPTDGRWYHDDDAICSVTYITVFNEAGYARSKPIHFIPFFAARWSHP
jgi:hypothetical protein